MKKKRTILAFTASRSDYDLMSYLYRLLAADSSVDLRLLVSGAHLSPTYGMTVSHIKKDGIPILACVETLIDSDSDAARIKSAAMLLQECIPLVEGFSPDLIIYAGDREEVIMAALAGGYLKIPTAHFFAGDHDRDGLIDNPVRHATSRLSSFKFVSLEEHRARLRALGENPRRIFTIGSCALDKFVYEPVISRRALFSRLGDGRRYFDAYALVIFHSLMGHERQSINDFEALLQALKNQHIPAVVNLPNTDPGSRALLRVMEAHAAHPGFLFVSSLERALFVNLYRHASLQIGNSSSGILEAASIPLGVINVGPRMEGRAHQKNVVFVDARPAAIERALERVRGDEFQRKNVKGIKNIYGDGHSSRRAYAILKKLPLAHAGDFRKEDPCDYV